MDTLAQDLAYAFRTLRRRPGFAAIVAITLGLGIGASTAIFTVFDAALLRPLPFPDPERLVFMGETSPARPYPNQASHPDYRDWTHARSFESIGAYAHRSAILTGGEAAERVRASRVTASLLPTLGVRPLLGRHFTVEEEAEGGAVILSHGLWQRRFGGDAKALGRTLEVNGAAHTIVGVLPAEFVFARTGPRDLWVPLRPSRNEQERRYQHMFWVVGRLRAGKTLEDARAEMASIAGRTSEIDPQWHAGRGIGVVSLHHDVVASVRPVLHVLLAGVGLVLLIACANVASVLLARGAEREREIVLRTALGASARRVMSQAFVESLVLAALGGALGVLWAGWGVQGLVAAVPDSVRVHMPYLDDLHLDARILLFAAAVTVLTGMLAGVLPALGAARLRLIYDRLRAGGHTIAAGRHRLQDALVTAEVALALMLLLGAGLLTRSFARLMAVDPGFDTRDLLTFQVSVPPRLAGEEAALSLERDLLARLAALPGVRGAAAVDTLPLMGGGGTGSPTVVGRPPTSARDELSVHQRDISADYFRVMGIPLLDGRVFSTDDIHRRATVVVINEALRRRLFPEQRALGQQVTFAFTGETRHEIVGVVGNERVTTLDAEPPPTLYWPSSGGLGTAVVVRTAASPETLAGAIERVVRDVSRDVAVSEIATMDELIAASPRTFLRRYPALLLGSFGISAVALAMIGIYGVLSHHTARRTREIGVRMALGARPMDVLALVLGRVAVLALAGIAVGAAGSLLTGRALSALLFQVAPGDPWATTGAAAVMLTLALAAGYWPARRAMSVDPTRALRSE